MTSAILGEGQSNYPGGETCLWIVDYDDASETIGLTCTGQASSLVISVTITASGTVYALDCIKGRAGNILNAGRVVLAGPGSVIQQPAPVRPGSFPLPPFQKGVAPPYTFQSSWTP